MSGEESSEVSNERAKQALFELCGTHPRDAGHEIELADKVHKLLCRVPVANRAEITNWLPPGKNIRLIALAYKQNQNVGSGPVFKLLQEYHAQVGYNDGDQHHNLCRDAFGRRDMALLEQIATAGGRFLRPMVSINSHCV